MKLLKNKSLSGILIALLIILGIVYICLHKKLALTQSHLSNYNLTESETCDTTITYMNDLSDYANIPNRLPSKPISENDNNIASNESTQNKLRNEEQQTESPDTEEINTTSSQYNHTTTTETIENQLFIEELNPSEQALLQAGIGVIIQLDATKFAVLSDADGTIYGQDGGLYLIDYLARLGLEGSVSGGWLPNADYYCYTANNVQKKRNLNDESSWD